MDEQKTFVTEPKATPGALRLPVDSNNNNNNNNNNNSSNSNTYSGQSGTCHLPLLPA
jgi:hypothetical protein